MMAPVRSLQDAPGAILRVFLGKPGRRPRQQAVRLPAWKGLAYSASGRPGAFTRMRGLVIPQAAMKASMVIP